MLIFLYMITSTIGDGIMMDLTLMLVIMRIALKCKEASTTQFMQITLISQTRCTLLSPMTISKTQMAKFLIKPFLRAWTSCTCQDTVTPSSLKDGTESLRNINSHRLNSELLIFRLLSLAHSLTQIMLGSYWSQNRCLNLC